MAQNIPDMSGKVCLVTGATGGIGRVTAETLARAGARIVLVGRNPQKTADAAREIQQNSGSAQVEYLLGDLSVQADVRRIAGEFRVRSSRLDVLINNAGAFFWQRAVSRDGIEMTFALNHLGYFLLTHQLLDLLVASAPARIVNVSSAAHYSARLNFAELQNERGYSGWKAYAQSKLANVYFTYELACRLSGSGVTANVLHPGFVATNFGRSNGGILNPLVRLFQLAAISPEQGARTTIYLASSPEVEGVTGKYFDQSRPVRSSAVSYAEEPARRLWEVSLAMTGLPVTV